MCLDWAAHLLSVYDCSQSVLGWLSAYPVSFCLSVCLFVCLPVSVQCHLNQVCTVQANATPCSMSVHSCVVVQLSVKQGGYSCYGGVHSRAVVAHVVADAVAKAQAQAAEEQAARDAAKAEYEAELAKVSTSPHPRF